MQCVVEQMSATLCGVKYNLLGEALAKAFSSFQTAQVGLLEGEQILG